MPANVEIKARLRDPEDFGQRVASLANSGPELLMQEDVFFEVPNGRLKLRIFGAHSDDDDRRGELIHYQRADTAGPKQSTYTISPTRDVAGLRAALSDALGVVGVIRKRRTLYLIGQTRVHIDRVDDLGDFVELEVVLRGDQSAREGEAIAEELMNRLDIRPKDLVEVAYLDLLLQKEAP